MYPCVDTWIKTQDFTLTSPASFSIHHRWHLINVIVHWSLWIGVIFEFLWMSGKSKTLYRYGWEKKSSIFYCVKQLTSFSYAIMCYDWQLATDKHCMLKKETAHCWVWVGVGGVGEERGTPVTCWQCLVPILIGGLLPHPLTPTIPRVIFN